MSRLILNRYEPVEPKGKTAGEGVSGIVIKARDTQGQYGVVAIKRPNPMLSPVDSRKKSGQIKREGEALKRLNHPSACRYVEEQDLSTAGGYILVMEWAEGTQLESRLRELERNGEVFPLGEALEILDQLASLLAHAHQQEVVHNDIDAKHLFWNGVNRHLTVIDWANCALGSDTKTIATAADDLKQYGELMHRLLTGSTLDIATRLGKESGWRIEMEDRRVPPMFQNIVARSVGRDGRPYDSMSELSTELSQYKLQQNKPFEEKVGQINALLGQEQHTYESLAQAKALIAEVAAWDPTLIRRERIRLEQIEQDRAQNLAIVRAKVSVKNEEWDAAHQRIESACGSNPEQMPAEARLIYWLSALLAGTKPHGAAYELRQQAAVTLLLHDTPNLELAQDYLLLSYGPDQPDHDSLLAELAGQTGQPYPPLRSRLPQAGIQVAEFLEAEVSEQLRYYQEMQKRVGGASAPARQLLDSLIGTLQEADNAAENQHSYRRAGEHFNRAFHIDPHNYRLYALAELMDELSQAAKGEPGHWPESCDELAGRKDYSFTAAQHYLHQARGKFAQFIQRNLEYIRQFRLDTAWTDLENIRQEHSLSPALQAVWLICVSYRHLYGYADGEAAGIPTRLERAAAAAEQARRENIGDGPPELSVELDILTALIRGYRILYEKGLPQLQSIQAELAELSGQEQHRLVNQTLSELDRLAQWKQRYESLLDECERYRYTQALAYVQRYQESDKDRDAFQWLAPAFRPGWPAWQQFCESAQQGLVAWQNRHYVPAAENFSTAEKRLPIYIDGQVPQKLKRDLKMVAGSLRAVQAGLVQSQKLLTEADNFENYRALPRLLEEAGKNESAVIQRIGGEPYLATSAELAGRFVQLARAGELEKLQSLIAQDRFVRDPLVAGYQRIVRVLGEAVQPNASLSQVEAALRLAPESRLLQQRKVDIEKFEQAFMEIIKAIRWADIGPAQNRLRTLKGELSTLPGALDCLEAVLLSYSYLIGDTRGNQLRSATDRISYANQSLGEAQRLLQEDDRVELAEEIENLASLIPIYWGINQYGLEHLDTAKVQISELQTRQSIVEPHEVISRLATELSGLERWKQRLKGLFEDLQHHHYAGALKRLQQMTDNEKQSLKWLNEAHQSDPGTWEQFCATGQDMIALWQAREYGQAVRRVVTLRDKLPGELGPVMSERLKEQYEAVISDLNDLQGYLDQSSSLLLAAEDPSAYGQADELLARARNIEGSYPAHLVGAPFIAPLHDRFQDFRRFAWQGNVEALAGLISEANEEGDPLASGYERICTMIEQGKASGAGPQLVALAKSLAPEAYFGDQDMAQSAAFRTGEWGIVSDVLEYIWQGDLEAARHLVRNAPGQAAIDCLWHICTAYHHLYGQDKDDQTIKERINKARQVLFEANCAAVAEPELRQQLEQEAGTLDALIWAYNEIHVNKLSNLKIVREDERVRRMISTQGDHAFVRRLIEELEALDKLKTRWQRISYYWNRNQYKQAWQEVKEITLPETAALGWLWDELQVNWHKWQDVMKTQSITGRVKLLGGLAAVALVLMLCVGAVAYGLAGAFSRTADSPDAAGAAVTTTPLPLQAGAALAATPTSEPEPTPTVQPTETSTLEPQATATETLVPEPTATPPLFVGDANRGIQTDVLALERWADLTVSNAETPKVYTTPPDFWHLVTGEEAHAFWIDQVFQEFPFEFRVTLTAVVPEAAYGVVLQDQASGQPYGMIIEQDEAGQGQFRIISGDEVIGSGPVATYDFTQATRRFNSLTVKVINNSIAFIVNDEEQVYVYQAPETFKPGWKVGVYAGPGAHSLIGSAYLYQLNPAQ